MKMTRPQCFLLTLLVRKWSRETITASEREERRLEIESAIEEGKLGAHQVKTPWPFTEQWGFFV